MAMPIYEFYCEGCKRKIEVIVSVRQYEEGEWVCNICQRKLRRLYSKISVGHPEVFGREARKWMLGENYGKEW